LGCKAAIAISKVVWTNSSSNSDLQTCTILLIYGEDSTVTGVKLGMS
jgi:hypothetical protein